MKTGVRIGNIGQSSGASGVVFVQWPLVISDNLFMIRMWEEGMPWMYGYQARVKEGLDKGYNKKESAQLPHGCPKSGDGPTVTLAFHILNDYIHIL
jgi:hypothetical protein